MRSIFLIAIATLIFLNLGCEHEKAPLPEPGPGIDTTTPQKQDFSCIKLFDEVGQTWGIHGDCTTSNDWGNITLNAKEQALLNFSDTVSLDGTTAATITQFAIAPCPVKIEGALHLRVQSDSPNPSLKIKIAIVDDSLKVVWQFARKIQNGNNLALYMDPAKFESGKYYRMYYRISASGAPLLFEGYGNFLVCKTYIDGVNTTIESDCF